MSKQRAVTQLDGIFGKYKPNVIRSASQLARTLRCKYRTCSTLCTLCTMFLCFVFDFSRVCLFCFSIIDTNFLVNKGEYNGRYTHWRRQTAASKTILPLHCVGGPVTIAGLLIFAVSDVWYYYFVRGSGGEVLWWARLCVCMYVCVSVCLSVREHYLQNHTRNFYQTFVHVAYRRGSVLLTDYCLDRFFWSSYSVFVLFFLIFSFLCRALD